MGGRRPIAGARQHGASWADAVSRR